MTFCSKCGEAVQEDAYFCHRCGHLTDKGEEQGAHNPWSNHHDHFNTNGDARFLAEENKSYNGRLTTKKATFETENINGPIRIQTWDKPEYNIELMIDAWGYTRDEAEENLKLLKTELEDEIVEGQQRLALNIDYPNDINRHYRVDIDITLPADCEFDSDVRSKNGRITLEGMKGGVINVETKNGRVSLKGLVADEIVCRTKNGRLILDDVSAGIIKGRSSNGKIEGKIESKSASLSTSNGKIDLILPCSTSGEYELRTSNGGIELDTSRASKVGFDINMRTSMGRINVDLPDLEYKIYGKNRIAARTNGFDGKEVQISIEAETSMGKIWLN
jgi:DUF4097 and DUF4098 domain-containing protein YvlB